MPQFAEFGPAAAWLKRHPQVRFVDLLLADLMGIPRGKRVTAAELEGVHGIGPAAAGLDVRARRARRHGAVHRPRLRRRRRRSRVPADRGHPRAGALARRRRRADAGQHVRARPHAVPRRSAARARASVVARFTALGLQARDGRRTRVLPGRPRAHAGGPCAAAAAAADRPPRSEDADQLDAGTGRVLGRARRDRLRPHASRNCPSAPCSPNTVPASSR